MAQRIRRVRLGAVAVNPHKEKAEELLQLISNIEVEISDLNSALKENMEELEEHMRKGHLSSVSAGDALAEFVKPAGKAQNIIDPKKFYERVDEDDFFSAVSVLVTKAKELLGEKELGKITQRIPGKTGEEKLKITHKK